VRADEPTPEPALVDWTRTARRMRRMAAILAGLVFVAWIADGIVGDAGLRLRFLGELTGLALLAAFVAEVVIIGGAALGGMLRAGDKGERLAGSDVSFLPPQLRRGRRR
jgi:hypothetical protein